MTEVIYIDGAKGGSGATTCAVRLALALSGLGERTLVIDGDDECADGLEVCGLQGMNVYTLADAESGECRIKQAVLQHPASPNMYVLPTLGLKDRKFADAAAEAGARSSSATPIPLRLHMRRCAALNSKTADLQASN